MLTESHMPRHTLLLRSLAAAALLVAVASTGVQAQAPDTVSAPPSPLALGLDSGSVVRVASPEKGQVEGRLLRITDSVIVLGVAGAERSLALHRGDTLWVRDRGTARGAKVGAAVALGAGGFLAAALFSTCESGGDDPCTNMWGIVPGVLGITGIGAFIGATVGSLFPQWHRRAP